MTMNKRNFQRSGLLAGLIGLLLAIGGFGAWLFHSQRHQYIIDRQLITSLMKRDTSQALLLVQKGADPNTQFDPPPVPSLTHLWDYLFAVQSCRAMIAPVPF
jgi:hypothetical protein